MVVGIETLDVCECAGRVEAVPMTTLVKPNTVVVG